MHLQAVTLRNDEYPTEDHYPFNLPVLRATSAVRFTAPVTFFVGENGSGKSTLLEAMAGRCGIHIWRDPDTRRMDYNPYEEALTDFISVQWANGRVPGSFFGSDIFGHFASAVEGFAKADPGQLKHFGGKSLITQSHGQSLMSYFRSRYQLKGLYLLDEPETALSPKTQLELLKLIIETSGAGHAQFIIASHSPILLACPGATIYSFDSLPLEPVAYEQTDHYRIYKDFMADRSAYLRALTPGS